MKKRKILYHRLAIVIIAGLLILSVLFMGVVKVVGLLFPDEQKVAERQMNEAKTAPQAEKEYTVVIDAGHGGYDGGSEGLNGVLEKDVTLDIALQVGSILDKREDIQVLYTREDDDWYWTYDNIQDLSARVNLAVDNEADLFLSLHMNDTEEEGNIRGFDVWVSLTSQENLTFAQNVHDALASLAYTEDRGIQDEALSPLHVLHYNTSPAILVEMGFMSNEQDLSYLTSKEGKELLSMTLAEAMIKTLEDNGK